VAAPKRRRYALTEQSRRYALTEQNGAAVVAPVSATINAESPLPEHESDIDSELSDYIRQWRRNTAREQGIAAFIVMHDSTLDALCRIRPTNLAELHRVPGFGERKIEMYGRQVLDALRRFEQGARAALTPQKKRSKPAAETLTLLGQGHSLAEISAIRGRQMSSVVQLVAEMIEAGQVQFERKWIGEHKVMEIEAACVRVGTERLKPIKDALPESITFDEIRLVVADLKSRGVAPSVARSAQA